MHTATTAELIDLLSHYAGYKLAETRTAAVDIFTRTEHAHDCDLRAVDTDGVGIFFYNARETKAWSDVTEVHIHGLDANWERVSTLSFRHIGAERVAA
jgi:hypothetical protein